MNRQTVVKMMVLGAALVFGSGAGYGLVLQPDEAASQDVFVYQGMPTFNFETSGPGFQAILAAGKTGSGHDQRSLIAFDLSGVPFTPAQVTGATLNLYVRDGTTVGFPFGNPDAAHPIDVSLSAAGAPWTESTVNWNTQPAAGALLDTKTVTGINGWVRFDVTDQVKAWLGGAANYGFRAESLTVSLNDAGQKVCVVFNSASAASERPYLEIVPEPATLALLLAGAAAIRRRRAV